MKPIFKFDIVANKSKTYMLPLLMKHVKIEFENYIQNTYLSFEGEDDIFCILYNWSSIESFLTYEGAIMDHPMYIGHVDYGDKVLYKFQLTHEIRKSRDLFVKGKLKEISEEHKQLIIKYVNDRGFRNADRIRRIVETNGDLISGAPDMNSETSQTQINQLIIKPDFEYESTKEER